MSGGFTITTEEEIIVVGDKVDIVTQSGQVYRTMIEDHVSNGPYLASVPNKKGVYMFVHQDDDVYLVFYRETGRYIAQMKVVALESQGEIRYMWLMQKTKAQKNQRRQAYRLLVDIDTKIFGYPDDLTKGLMQAINKDEEAALESVISRDISVTGIALLTRKKYELNDRYLLSLQMDRDEAGTRTTSSTVKPPALHLTASVRRCAPWRTGNIFNTGMEFFGMTEAMSDGIAKYVLLEQQKQIKRRRRLI